MRRSPEDTMIPVQELLTRQGQLEEEVTHLKATVEQLLNRVKTLEHVNSKCSCENAQVISVSVGPNSSSTSSVTDLVGPIVIPYVTDCVSPITKDQQQDEGEIQQGQANDSTVTAIKTEEVPCAAFPQEDIAANESNVSDLVQDDFQSVSTTKTGESKCEISHEEEVSMPMNGEGDCSKEMPAVEKVSDSDKDPILEVNSDAQNISEPSEIKSCPARPTIKGKLVDIGLQTDLEEDPEVYYFAGGRHVGSQTDYDNEYEPLIPFKANTKLEIIVLNSSPPGACVSSTIWEQESSDVAQASTEISSSSRAEDSEKTLIDETTSNNKAEKDGWKTVTARSNRTKWSQSSSSLGSSAASSSRGSIDRSSIGDYRDRGLTGSTLSRGRLSSSSSQALRGSPASHFSGGSHPRPRNQQQQQQQPWKVTGRGSISNTSNTANFLKSRFYQPSSTISLPVLNDSLDDVDCKKSSGHNSARRRESAGYGSKENLLRKKSGSTVNVNTGGALKPKPQNTKPGFQQRSTQTTKKPTAVGTGTPAIKSDAGVLRRTNERSTGPVLLKTRGTVTPAKVPGKPTSVRSDKDKNSSSGIAKKKADSSSGSSSASNSSSIPSARLLKTQSARTTTTSAAATPTVRKMVGSSSAKSSVKSTGGFQGTMKKREPKAKEEPAPKVKSQVVVVPEPETPTDCLEDSIMLTPASCMSNVDKWREQDNESSNDDEEIQLKEVALANAIMESELLAEELLQVEKDFEEIESRAADNVSVDEGSNISECGEARSSPSTFPESETENEMNDYCGDLDQFFFIAIKDTCGTNSDDNLEERIVAKKEKLRLSPAKKCDREETLKRHRAKLAKAERNREKLLQAKYNRYVELSERFASLNETTKRLVEERCDLMAKADQRRKRAAEKREEHLKNIVKKAHDEDSKAKEIAFINLLEAQNKRHDYLANVQEVEDRLNSIQEERNLKFQDRAIKVQAVIERQGHIRLNWETKLASMQEKRRKIDERIVREREERAKERSELAQEKARDREERLSALNAAKQAEKEELQKKIQLKQQETARRHEENIEHIRQKAIELTLPRTSEESAIPTVRMCSLCKVTMVSEVQELAHLRSRAHLDAVKKMEQENAGTKIENFGLKFITDVHMDKIGEGVRHDKNRSKKHCKKLMLKLLASGQEFEKAEKEQRVDKPWGDPTLKAKVVKNLKELERGIGCFATGKGSLSLANSMDKLLSDIRRTINKNKSVQDAVISLGAFSVVSKILRCEANDLPPKILVGACNLVVGATYQHLENGMYAIKGTVVCSLIDLVVNRLNNLIPDGSRWLAASPGGSNESLQADTVADFAIETLLTLLSVVPDPYDGISSNKEVKLKDSDVLEIVCRTQDIIAYLVSANVIDRLSVYCSGVQGPVDNQPSVANLLKISLDFLTSLVWCLTFCLEKRSSMSGSVKREPDPTQLLATLESSELAGSISMSYALLLYQGAPIRPRLIKTDSDLSAEEPVQGGAVPCGALPPAPPAPGSRTASVVKSTLCLVNAVARLDISALQNILGSEAVSLQFRHIASQLIWQVVPHREDRLMWGLLQELFIAIGHFTVNNLHNQTTIQSGQTPTVLQQLCAVAREFLSDLRLSRSILPTLIAATHGCQENRDLLVQENFPTDLLDGFLESKFSHANIILKRLVSGGSTPPNNCNNNINANSIITNNNNNNNK